MSGLKTLQAAFARHLMQGDDAITSLVSETVKPDREFRLAIYRNAYYARLMETLASDFPRLNVLMGEDAFSSLCQRYIEAHPSRHFSLRFLGQNFSDYLQSANLNNECGNSVEAIKAWMVEMARFEWALIDSFDAADQTTLTEIDAAKIPPAHWPDLNMTFHPSVRTLQLQWNTLDRWHGAGQVANATDDGAVARECSSIDCQDEDRGITADTACLIPQPLKLSVDSDCLVWRNELTTRFRSMDFQEYTAFSAAVAGQTFAEICGQLAGLIQDQESVPMLAAGFLKQWLTDNMITRLSV